MTKFINNQNWMEKSFHRNKNIKYKPINTTNIKIIKIASWNYFFNLFISY